MSGHDQIWRELYDADRLTRYFGQVSNKFRKYHAWVTYATILSAFLAAMPLMVSPIPNFISAVLFLVVGFLVLTTVFWDFSAKATSARLASASYSQISQELQSLWHKGASQSQIDTLRQIKMSIANSTNIDVDETINKRAEDEAYEYLREWGSWARSAS